MKLKQPHPLQAISALLMIAALLWLTVCTPFVYGAAQLNKQATTEQCEESNPFANTTEEKNENSSGNASEYLHDAQNQEHPFTEIAKRFKCHPTDTYLAFHPESFSPPPEA